MGFADSHVHLHFPDYDADRSEVIERARSAGVDLMINVGTDVPTTRASIDLAETYDFIYATAGIHPHDAKDADEAAWAELEKALAHPRVVAVGEVGLDYFRDHSPREVQKKVLGRALQLHRKSNKPLVIHCRDAYEDMIEFLKSQQAPPFHGIMHCFSSDKETMKRFLDLGFYISFAGPLTYKKNDVLREACRACPKERLILETDAPFLPPQSKRGKRNETGYMLETAAVAAELHGLGLEALSEQTSLNTRAVFGL